MKIKKRKTKTCVIKRKLEFQDYKNCLEVAQIETKIKPVRKKFDLDSLKEDKKEFRRNNKLILKTHQRFRNKKHVFTEEFNKIALSSDDDQRMQSTDSIETYAYRASKDLVSEKEDMKCHI